MRRLRRDSSRGGRTAPTPSIISPSSSKRIPKSGPGVRSRPSLSSVVFGGAASCDERQPQPQHVDDDRGEKVKREDDLEDGLPSLTATLQQREIERNGGEKEAGDSGWTAAATHSPPSQQQPKRVRMAMAKAAFKSIPARACFHNAGDDGVMHGSMDSRRRLPQSFRLLFKVAFMLVAVTFVTKTLFDDDEGASVSDPDVFRPVTIQSLDQTTKQRARRNPDDSKSGAPRLNTDAVISSKPAQIEKIGKSKAPPIEIRVPQSLSNLSDLTAPYERKVETPYFWDVHFSGETVAEKVFAKCWYLVQACEHGLQQPEFNEDKLEIFYLDGTKYVNVDTVTLEGMSRAQKLGLSKSRIADVIISPALHDAAEKLFASENPGRMFALFRHPVDRAVSMYYYLATASWDPMYKPELLKMSLAEYARSGSIENNWVTRFLVNKPGGRLNKTDLLIAKEVMKRKVLIGLFSDMGTSLARFERYFGWTKEDRRGEVKRCRNAFVEAGDKRHEHPNVERGSKEWELILDSNRYDMELYEYARVLYRVQGEQIFGIVGNVDVPL